MTKTSFAMTRIFEGIRLGFTRMGLAALAAAPALGLLALVTVDSAFAQSGSSGNVSGPSDIYNAPDFVTPIGKQMEEFHNLLMIVITGIVLFVLGLLAYVMIRFNAKANPTPSKTTHNAPLEIAWTLIPVLILLVIAVPSFRLIYAQEKIEDAEVTIKMTGYQWYWGATYPDHEGLEFDMLMVADEDLKPGQPRLLTVDNVAYMPSDTKVRFQVTAADVIHAFSMPNFGIKMDAIPGRLNEGWAYVGSEHEGRIFYGQCAEICGTNHAFMPVAFKVVSRGEYDNWVKSASARLHNGETPGEPPIQLATSN